MIRVSVEDPKVYLQENPLGRGDFVTYLKTTSTLIKSENALLNNVVPFILFGWGQTHIASGLASILNATTPIWGVVVAHLSHPHLVTWAGGIVIVAEPA